jgi:glutamyl-Q tRNA(Asp) synthetase
LKPVYRFAPSPNGYLHLGHALSALDGFEKAQNAGGRFLLRMEDIDTTRCRDEFVTAIFEDLSWLGLTWEMPVLRQSEHFSRYRMLADKLSSMGVLYPCFATRSDIALATARNPIGCDPDGAPLYPGLHKGLSKSQIEKRMNDREPFSLRLDMEKALRLALQKLDDRLLTFTEIKGEGIRETILANPEVWGDAIIVRKETPTSYHLSVVADDALQGITCVTRGRDLYAATGLHRLLQVLLDLPEPDYSHHRLLTAPDGRKLAKSVGDTSIRDLRASGATPGAIRAMLQLK